MPFLMCKVVIQSINNLQYYTDKQEFELRIIIVEVMYGC